MLIQQLKIPTESTYHSLKKKCSQFYMGNCKVLCLFNNVEIFQLLDSIRLKEQCTWNIGIELKCTQSAYKSIAKQYLVTSLHFFPHCIFAFCEGVRCSKLCCYLHLWIPTTLETLAVVSCCGCL